VGSLTGTSPVETTQARLLEAPTLPKTSPNGERSHAVAPLSASSALPAQRDVAPVGAAQRSAAVSGKPRPTDDTGRRVGHAPTPVGSSVASPSPPSLTVVRASFDAQNPYE